MSVTTRKVAYVNYQARSHAFHRGDSVFPTFGGSHSNAGIVVAVWPAIGMVDVSFPSGVARYPVEDLQLDSEPNPGEAAYALQSAVVPGGVGTVSVSGGPPPPDVKKTANTQPPKPLRVAAAYVKRAVYWGASDRKYKASKQELESGQFCCPRCEDAYLRTTVYKREGGRSVKLFCCPECLFLLRRDDVLGLDE